MGTFTVEIQISGSSGQRFETVNALVDTGASITVMPESLMRPIGVAPTRYLKFQDASGAIRERGVADTHMRVEGMDINAAVMFGEEGVFLLGAQTLEELFPSHY